MVRLVLVAASVVLIVVLVAGCGGGGSDSAKVEANLRHYIVGLVPGESSPFPVGAGTPSVKHDSCRDRHVRVDKGHMMWSRSVTFWMGIDVALWTCVVKLGTIAVPVNVVVDDSTEVVRAVPGALLRTNEPNARHPSAGSSP